MAMEPYSSHTEIERVPNDEDDIFTNESASKLLPHRLSDLN